MVTAADEADAERNRNRCGFTIQPGCSHAPADSRPNTTSQVGWPQGGTGSPGEQRSDPGSMAGPISRSLSIVVQTSSATPSIPDVHTQACIPRHRQGALRTDSRAFGLPVHVRPRRSGPPPRRNSVRRTRM
jgi:hypothetical protein